MPTSRVPTTHGRRIRTTGLRVLTFLVLGSVLSALPSGVLAATPSRSGKVDANVAAGAKSAPDMRFLRAVAKGCTRHVAERRDDPSVTEDGLTPATAWRTVAKAMELLTPGQTACVHKGRYEENGLVPASTGTPRAPIAIMGAPDEARPTIVAKSIQPGSTPGSSTSEVRTLFDFGPGKAYWLVEGLDVDKNKTNGAIVQVLGGDHIAVRNNVLQNGKSGAAVLITQGAKDVIVEGNEISHHHRWQDPNDPKKIEYVAGDGLRRSDANAVNVEGSGVARVLIRRNHLHDNGGDGFQCIGHHDDQGPSSGDGADIDLVDNRIENNAENAIDIKSCQRVSVRGSVSPDRVGSAADNKLMNVRPTDKNTDLLGNHSAGEAVIIHLYARRVLIENTRIWSACTGIAIGRADLPPVDSVIIRRTLLFDVKGPSESVVDNKCAGNGIRITSAKHVDIHHNTFDGIPTRAVMLANDNGNNSSVSDDIDIWNNIISQAGTWIALRRHGPTVPGGATRVDNDRNVFWSSDGSSNHFELETGRVDLSLWQSGTGRDRTSIQADPLFVDRPMDNDYYVQPRSPALDTALKNTKARFCGAGPDIGFRERCL